MKGKLHDYLKKFETKHFWHPSKLKSKNTSSKLKNVPMLGAIGKSWPGSGMIIIETKKRTRIGV